MLWACVIVLVVNFINFIIAISGMLKGPSDPPLEVEVLGKDVSYIFDCWRDLTGRFATITKWCREVC